MAVTEHTTEQHIAGPHASLADLEAALRRDLALLQYPKNDWVLPHTASDGRRILDVLIIGGGQSGLVSAFGLMRERVGNILVIDENPRGCEGPWRTFARMKTLRTPKHLTGPDLGLPNLTIQAWYESQHGPGAWEGLGLIPKETWAQYLDWYRDFLQIPVRSETAAGAIEWLPEEECFRIPVNSPDGDETLLARYVVLATGIDGSGQWAVPRFVSDALPKHLYSHTRWDIEFNVLKGKRVGVIGAGASAFDNASVALENGAAEVRMFFRRPELVRVNPYRWAEFTGFLRNHRDLPDADKWRFVSQIIRMGQLPPADTFERAKKHPNFHLHPGSGVTGAEAKGDGLVLHTEKGSHEFDYLIVGTGFVTDLSRRPELGSVHPKIALWRDRFTPPQEDASNDLLNHPYLGANFELTEKQSGEAPWVNRIFNYTFGCLLSQGFGGASISGMKYSVPHLVEGITRRIYLDDRDAYFKALREFDLAEF